MIPIRAVLRNRRRSQRGSVLSGVLIMTAFVAIIAGALTTELSANFLLSRNLVTRVSNQATVDSSVELAISSLQAKPISQGCPVLGSATLNGRTATATYLGCAPTVRNGEPQDTTLAQSTAFNVDGTYASIGSVSLNDYVVGDSSGVLRDFTFGRTTGWTYAFGGGITATPLVTPDLSEPPDVAYLVPLDSPTANGGCGSSYCVGLLDGTAGTRPGFRCYLTTSAAVVSTPGAGRNIGTVAFVGDSAGNVVAFDQSEDGQCAQQAIVSGPTRAIVFGPAVFPGPKSSEILYVVATDSTGSELDSYRYSSGKSGPSLTFTGALALPAANAVGAAIDQSTLPARIAIAFAGGTVAIASISTGFAMSLSAAAGLPTAVSDAPYWCQCPGGSTVVGVGGQNGGLYLFDTSLNTLASLPAGGPAIATTPQSDGVGDWFFGAADGYLYETQQTGSSMKVVGQFGPMNGAVTSGVQVAGCSAGLCAYMGSSGGAAYLIQLDARNAVISACISSTPPSCSGENPRLWASVQIGAAGSPQTVHVEGWSYYSP